MLALVDADSYGADIARVVRDGSKRAPGCPEVEFLGLTPEQAVEMGLETETYLRDRALSAALIPRLTPLQRSWWEGTPTGHSATRVAPSSAAPAAS